MLETQFTEIISLIKNARTVALKSVNSTLINLYWTIGEYIHNKVKNAEWGQSVVKELAKFLSINEPNLKALLREISWSHNLAIFSRCSTIEEQEFYLRLSKNENWIDKFHPVYLKEQLLEIQNSQQC